MTGSLRAVTLLVTCLAARAGAQERTAPVPLWEAPDRLAGMCPTERAAVARIDELWNRAGSGELLKWVEGPSEPSRVELEDRLAMSLLGGDPVRRSRILAREEYEGYVSLLLSCELKGPGDDAEPRRFDELCVLRRGPDGPRPVYLVQTSLDWLRHVTAERDGRPLAGLVLSKGARFTCPACNYHLELPRKGRWMLYPRPVDKSGHLEAVDLLALDRDLGLDLSLVPIPEAGLAKDERRARVQALLARSSVLFRSCGGRRLNRPDIVPTKLSGFEAWTCTLLRVEGRQGRRFYKFYGMPHAALDYLVSIHGSAALLADDELMMAVEDAFRLMDPTRDEVEGLTILRRLMKGLGSFDGDTFRVARPALSMKGPAGWDKAVRPGKDAFQAVWDCPVSGANLQLRGMRRPMDRPWSPEAVRDWVGRFLGQNRRMHEGFEYGKLAPVDVGERRGFALDFGYDACKPCGETCGRAEGRLLLVTVDDLLVVVVGVSQPGRGWEAVRDQILAAMSSLRID
ncbi:MAG: hypothetical protein R3F30_01870 [Planctomycetota bacterium]